MRPALQVLERDSEETEKSCPEEKPCGDCPFFFQQGGLCEGCEAEEDELCDQGHCFSYCNNCGGGGRVTVPACCGHSPLRNSWAEDVSEWPARLEPAEVDAEYPLIPMIYEQIRDLRVPERFPEIDTWAVPVSKVLNLDGTFKADDLKQHNGLPDDRKLLLVNSADDRYMEMLWRHGDELDFRGHNIDYWTPAFFSIYLGDSKFNHFFNAFRQQLNAADMNSQFVWFHCVEEFPEELFDPILEAKSIILSAQNVYGERRRRMLLGAIDSVSDLMPDDAKIFLLAGGGLKRSQMNRRVYQINSRWLQLGIWGRDLRNRPRPKFSREELLICNLRKTCERWVS